MAVCHLYKGGAMIIQHAERVTQVLQFELTVGEGLAVIKDASALQDAIREAMGHTNGASAPKQKRVKRVVAKKVKETCPECGKKVAKAQLQNHMRKKHAVEDLTPPDVAPGLLFLEPVAVA